MRKGQYRLDGQCVYCLEKFEPHDLTDEHIIPRALGGTLIISKGACQVCARLSNARYENIALNTEFLIPRRILALKRSRRRGAGKDIRSPLPPLAPPDHLIADESKFDIFLNDDEYPKVFWLPNFPVAGKILGIERGGDITMLRFCFYNLRGHHSKINFSSRSPAVNGPYALTIAKIAYCYAVAERGFEGFDGSEIRDLLAGNRDDFYNFVGSALKPERLTNRHLHGLYFRERGEWLTVLVHLFASCEGNANIVSNIYEIVVGKKKNNPCSK